MALNIIFAAMAQDERKVKLEVPRGEEGEKKKDEKTFADRDRERDEQQKKFLEKTPDDAPEPETEEDRALREKLELLVTRVTEPATTPDAITLQQQALEQLRSEIRSSTSSMTSVPKPLKYLRKSYKLLTENHATLADSNPNKRLYADILSVLAMTMGEEGKRESLKYRLLGNQEEAPGQWGHEYLRSLAGEIAQEWHDREGKAKDDGEFHKEDLLGVIRQVIPHNMEHNAEVDAVDLLMEVEQLDLLRPHINVHNVQRVCTYIVACAQYIADPEEQAHMLQVVFDAYMDTKLYPDALRVAMMADKKDLVQKTFETVHEGGDRGILLQLAYMLGWNKGSFEPAAESPLADDSDIKDAMGNVHFSAKYLELAKDMGVLDPKTPEDIYKSHLAEGGPMSRHNRPAGAAGAQVDSAKQNLASTFVNSFVNLGFGKDLLLTPEGSEWLFKNKQDGMMSAAGSLGMILLWDVESGFSQTDKYSASNQSYIKAGSLLASGVLSSGITSEWDAAHALLSEHLEGDDVALKVAAIIGLGIAYAGTERSDVLEVLVPLIVDEKNGIEVVAQACLSLGLVFVGSANEDISGSIIEAFMDRSETDTKDSSARLMCLGLGLLFLGKGELCEGALSAITVIEKPIQKYLEITVETCAYAGTGSVLQVQKLLKIAGEHIPEDEKDPMKSIHQEAAVLGIAMVAMGESLSAQMALRALDHLLQYGEVNIRRAVPVAYALLSVSNPQLTVVDSLSKLSHDSDQQVSQNACLALGFVGAGTNNSRIAGNLRNLAAYYEKEPNHLFLTRIAQGLLHMGKGLVTLSPFHSAGMLMTKVSMAGLLTVLHSALDAQHSLLSKRHYLLFSVACSVRPRCVITVDEQGNTLPVQVRVGQAVDTVGQPGKPRTITGFQTHTTPVLLSHGERAELATDKYIALTPILEGFVVLRKNPEYRAEGKERKGADR